MDKQELVQTINEVLDAREKASAEAKAKADEEAKAKAKAVESSTDDKTTEPPPPPPAETKEVESLKQDLASVKSKLDEQTKVLEKLGDFTKAAVKSQKITASDAAAATKGADDKGPKRDAWGRVRG